ncbi:DUF1501 domain-containing protein [Hahella sp. SMD15-11]|uniref:DUF1501 domain-containing protein n=1 Tax=Thermohahella caldifontis TaxID=3142973 RepID=A0AB39UUB9_9GAMM
MNRRLFMKLMAATGMAFSMPLTSRPALAATPDRFWVMVHAGGGWDPTSLIDPKGDAEREDGRGPVNHYAAADIRQVGNVRYAPVPTTGVNNAAAIQQVFDDFFSTLGPNLLVVNGIDTQTNSHTIGTRTVWSGSNNMGQPAFAAMVAAASGGDLPMPFVTNGGYDHTDGLVGASRVSGSGQFTRLAYPNRYNPGRDNDLYLPGELYALVEEARQDRLRALQQREPLPQRRRLVSELFGARVGDNSLERIVDKLPSRISGGIKGQAEMAAASFAAGLAVSANLVTGGFDTHGNHDNNHYRSLSTLLDGLMHLWSELERQGVADRTTVLVGSDFGRTPYYNGGNGKDHWNVTSMMAFGAGISGNRVIGGTSADFRALRVKNTSTLELEPDPKGDGLTLTTAHIHKSLRRAAGLEGTELDRKYPIGVEQLALFG